MNRTGSQSRQAKTDARRAASSPPRNAAQSWLLAAFVMVCVARALVPSEGVAWIGDGHLFTMLLLLISAGYLTLAAWRGRFTRPFGAVDGMVAALVLLFVASAVLGVLAGLYGAGNNPEFDARASSPRLAINMAWEWIALGLVFFLSRQLIGASLEARGVVAAMIALAVVLSGLGLFQILVTLPAERLAYAADPDQALREVGQWFPPGSPQRARFEDRLNSTEPTATFALANSLAGYLAPWLLMALGVGWSAWTARGEAAATAAPRPALLGARRIGYAACLVLVLLCLVLTKSRSAYLALAAGLLLLPLVEGPLRRLFHWKLAAAAVLLLALVASASYGVGGLDAEVLTEASKSLDYRLQYWEATLDMIANFPVLGVGPGEFQDYYTQYKRPEASEEVRDPHNFLLEAWATGGTFAFLILILILAWFGWQTWGLPPAEGDAAGTSENAFFVAGGGAAGVLVAYVAGLPFGFSLSVVQVVAALASGALVFVLLWPWIARGTLPRRLPALALMVLSVNLLAAGGFTIPGVAISFWLLLALGLHTRPAPAPRGEVGWRPRVAALVALSAVCGAIAACYQTAFFPVLACRAAMAQGLDASLSEAERTKALLAATLADPYSAEPWAPLAQLAMAHLKRRPDSELWGLRFTEATGAVSRLRPHSSASWQELSSWYRSMYLAIPSPDLADRLVETTRTAAMLYPNSAMLQAEYALAMRAANNVLGAQKAAAKALALDALTPHTDKKLAAPLKAQLAELLADAGSDAATPEPSPLVE